MPAATYTVLFDISRRTFEPNWWLILVSAALGAYATIAIVASIRGKAIRDRYDEPVKMIGVVILFATLVGPGFLLLHWIEFLGLKER